MKSARWRAGPIPFFLDLFHPSSQNHPQRGYFLVNGFPLFSYWKLTYTRSVSPVSSKIRARCVFFRSANPEEVVAASKLPIAAAGSRENHWALIWIRSRAALEVDSEFTLYTLLTCTRYRSSTWWTGFWPREYAPKVSYCVNSRIRGEEVYCSRGIVFDGSVEEIIIFSLPETTDTEVPNNSLLKKTRII
jgi:hypothetical protein